MTLLVSVEGGTNAGRRRVKPSPKSWRCACPDGFGESLSRLRPAYLARCSDCGTKRP